MWSRVLAVFVGASVTLARAAQASAPKCDLLQTCHDPSTCAAFAEIPPAHFSLDFHTTAGDFSVMVTTAWAVPYAVRAYRLAKIGYWDGAAFYRTLHQTSTASASSDSFGFVAQFGYRGDPDIDSCWDDHRTSNATWSVQPPGNVRGTVSFAMNAVQQTHSNPNCTSDQYCAQGFSTNIFVNYGNNSNLDAPGFSPFGVINDAGMAVVDKLYAGYGECVELCGDGSTDPYCKGTGSKCQGVSMNKLVSNGRPYLAAFPKLDNIVSVGITTVTP